MGRPTFKDYRQYLASLQAEMAVGDYDPDAELDEYVASASHVIDCFDGLLHGDVISRLEALEAEAWLKVATGDPHVLFD
ncbi:MAG: hypothetical protein GYA24_24620 [Candidatus Lokiarchaeota archaeon]|nr:hypothetical protein [Candidatus Lokiarchaeota archaeon]